MATSLSSYDPIVLVDIHLESIHRFATKDFYDAADNYYRGTLLGGPNISQELSDLYYGVEQAQSLTLEFSSEREEGPYVFVNLQDFTDPAYTEVDPNGRIAIAANTITFAGLTENEIAYAYYNFGVDYFKEDFEIFLDVKMTAADDGCEVQALVLANAIGDTHALRAAGENYVAITLYKQTAGAYQIYLDEIVGGAKLDAHDDVLVNTDYYLRVVRKRDEGDFGKIYCYIYTDAEHTDLQETLVRNLRTPRQEYRYCYGVCTYNEGNAIAMSGSISNLYFYKTHTWDNIAKYQELRGKWVVVQRYDPTDGTSFEFRGKISDYSLGPTVTVNVEMRDDDVLETLLPLEVVNTNTFATTALDLGEPVNIPFGHCRNVPLRNVANDIANNYYDYLIGYGVIESLWVDHANDIGVKRDGVLVVTSEYGTNAPDYDDGNVYDGSQATPWSGYACIRFTKEQMDYSGVYHKLTADVKGLELGHGSAERNFSYVIGRFFNGATWGLADTIDVDAFSTAATDLNDITNMYCDGAITEQSQARDILDDLLFPARARVERGADGKWTLLIDKAGASILDVGDNDGYYNNAEVIDVFPIPANESLKEAIVHYSLDPTNEKLPFKELSTGVHAAFGVTRTYELPFVLEDGTATNVLNYLKNRSIYSDNKAAINVGMEGRDLSRGQIITVTAPGRNLASKEYVIDKITKGGVSKFELECREYYSAIHDSFVITPPSDPHGRNYVVYGPETWVGPILLGDGVGQSASITLTVADGEGDIYIGAGKTDFTTADNGFIIGIDDSDGNKVKMYLGDATDYMYWNGANLVLSGNITANSGSIGGWIISATALADNAVAANANVYIDSDNTLIRLGPTTGDYLTLDGANLRIRSSNYVAGMAGAGFTLEPDLLEVGNIAARGIIRTAVFQKDIVSAVGGNLAVLPADVLATTMTALDNCHVVIEGNETFAVGDFLRIKDDTDDEWIEVTGAAGADYTVTRDMNVDYAADTNPLWKKGATVVNYRQSGDGFVYITASEANAPYLSVITHAGAPWTTLTTQMRLGNLNGSYGYVADAYGFAYGDSTLAGNYTTYDETSGKLIVKGLVEIIGNPSLQNMLMNGGFEETDGTNAYYWTSGVGISTEVAGGDDSNKYLKVVRAGGNNHPFYLNPDGTTRYFEVNEGETYELGGSLKSDTVCTAWMSSRALDKDKGIVEWGTTVTSLDAAWTTKSGIYTVPAGVKFLLLMLGAITADGWAAFDNIYLKRVDELAWSFTHASDRTKIDGGDVYVGSSILVGTGVTAGSIAINDATFGNAGIQLIWVDDAGWKAKFYAGDGANEYFQYVQGTGVSISTAQANAITIKSGGSITLEAGGDLIMNGADANPALLKWVTDGTDIHMGAHKTSDNFAIYPATAEDGNFYIGYEFGGGGSIKAFIGIYQLAQYNWQARTIYDQMDTGNDNSNIEIYSGATHTQINMFSDWDATHQAGVFVYADADEEYVRIDGSDLRPYANNSQELGTTDLRWKHGWMVDLTVTNCITEGTCEIIPGDALKIINDIVQPGSGIFDEWKHERFDMKRLHPKYPWLFVKDEGNHYLEKIGTKSDLLYQAVMQLDERMKKLENKSKKQI